MKSTNTLSQSQLEIFTRAMSLNTAAWTEASIKPYRVSATLTDTLWWRQPGGSGIYLPATIIDGHAPNESLFADLENIMAAWSSNTITLYDCWANRDLTSLGFEKVVQNPWYLRLPNPLKPASPSHGLTIEIVTTEEQLIDFERATWIGFEESEDAPAGREPFSQHHQATLHDPDMTYINGRINGEVVSSVIIHKTADMVGIYGLSTLPKHRRRGCAAALVHAATAMHTELPVTVFPDPPSVPIYTRIGFVVGGEIAVWQKKD